MSDLPPACDCGRRAGQILTFRDMQDKVKQELANAERQLREANEAATSALRRKREQLQADMERLEAEQRQRIAALPAGVAPGPLQEPVGLRVSMEESYEDVEGAEGAFAAGLKADLAAAVMASDARFEWCGMERGSVRALLNVLPDPTGRDARSAQALAEALVKQGSDAASSLRLRGVTRTVRNIEIVPPASRKHTSLHDWRALLPGTAGGQTLLPSKEEAASLAQRQTELDELEKEYQRRRQNLSLMEQRLKDEEARAVARETDKENKGDRHIRRVKGPPEEVSKVLKEMKDDIERRLAAVLASREAYKKERRALDNQRDAPDFSFRLTFLRQVKQAINQQAASLNADAARVKAVERSMKSSSLQPAAGGVEMRDWMALGGGMAARSWGDVSDENSDISSGLTSDTDTTVGSCGTMNKVKHTLAANFGPEMAFQELNERARYRRAVRHQDRYDASASKIHYPSHPPKQMRYDHEAPYGVSPRPRLSRYRSAYANYMGAGAVGAHMSPWNDQHRMSIMQNHVMKLAAQRELQRESINRHSSWLSVFRDRLSRPDFGSAYTSEKENANVKVNHDGEGAKISLGDGKAIVIRIETASQ